MPQNRATGRKALLAGCYTLGDCHQTLASSLIKLIVPAVGTEAQISKGLVIIYRPWGGGGGGEDLGLNKVKFSRPPL